MASSRPIAAGESYTPDDVNNLRADVLDSVGGHPHDGTDGVRIPFANLNVVAAAGSTAPSGGSKSYNDLANHVANSSNVHELPTGVYVAGAVAAKTLIQHGENVTGTVTFPVAFSALPTVVITGFGTPTGSNQEFVGYHITSITASGFVWIRANDSPQNIRWIAIGLKTS